MAVGRAQLVGDPVAAVLRPLGVQFAPQVGHLLLLFERGGQRGARSQPPASDCEA